MKTQSVNVSYEDLADYLRDRHPNLPDDLEVIGATSVIHIFGIVEFTVRSDTFPNISTPFKGATTIHHKGTDFEVNYPFRWSD